MRFGNGEKVSDRKAFFWIRRLAGDFVETLRRFATPILWHPSSWRSGVRKEWNVKRQAIRTVVFAGAFLLLILQVAQAQEKNEIGLVIGATVTPGRNLASASTPRISFDSSLALGAEYDHRVLRGHRVVLYGGVDFLASPLDVKVSNPATNVIGQYAYVFLTPHVRVKFNHEGRLSPWLSFGGGYARFLEKKPTDVPSFVPGTNTGTFVFGGGVDTRTVLQFFRIPIGFRAEVRDFYSGSPSYNQPVRGSLQNNVAFTGGLLIRF
jgi:hypothetical protein